MIAGRVALPACPTLLPDEANGEASLSVYKTENAAKLNQSFLLIFRTRHIVTVDAPADVTSSAGYTGFPAYSQMHTASLPMRGAANASKDLVTVLFGHVTLGRL